MESPLTRKAQSPASRARGPPSSPLLSRAAAQTQCSPELFGADPPGKKRPDTSRKHGVLRTSGLQYRKHSPGRDANQPSLLGRDTLPSRDEKGRERELPLPLGHTLKRRRLQHQEQAPAQPASQSIASLGSSPRPRAALAPAAASLSPPREASASALCLRPPPRFCFSPAACAWVGRYFVKFDHYTNDSQNCPNTLSKRVKLISL